jgi:hypothetical protein
MTWNACFASAILAHSTRLRAPFAHTFYNRDNANAIAECTAGIMPSIVRAPIFSAHAPSSTRPIRLRVLAVHLTSPIGPRLFYATVSTPRCSARAVICSDLQPLRRLRVHAAAMASNAPVTRPEPQTVTHLFALHAGFPPRCLRMPIDPRSGCQGSGHTLPAPSPPAGCVLPDGRRSSSPDTASTLSLPSGCESGDAMGAPCDAFATVTRGAPPDAACWVCCEGAESPAGGRLSWTGCACRGTSGFVHTPCLIKMARSGLVATLSTASLIARHSCLAGVHAHGLLTRTMLRLII